MMPIQHYVFFVERLKHARVMHRKMFLHTNLYRDNFKSKAQGLCSTDSLGSRFRKMSISKLFYSFCLLFIRQSIVELWLLL